MSNIEWFKFWPYWLIPCDPAGNWMDERWYSHGLFTSEILAMNILIGFLTGVWINNAYQNKPVSLKIFKLIELWFMIFATFILLSLAGVDFHELTRPNVEIIDHKLVVEGTRLSIGGNVHNGINICNDNVTVSHAVLNAGRNNK